MADHSVNQTFNSLLSRAALTIFHNAFQRLHVDTANARKPAKKLHSWYSIWSNSGAEAKLFVKFCITENSFRLAAEAYWRLTRQCWSV